VLRRRTALALIAALALAAASAASADTEKEQVRLTAEGGAAARAALPRKADFGSGWTSQAFKPSNDSETGCKTWHPKQADLVRNGEAGITFKYPGVQIDTEVQVLQTARMVALDWQRTVLAPQVVPCLRQTLVGSLPAGAKLVSVGRRPFPKVATYASAIRAVVDVPASGATLRLFVDLVAVGRGRTEVTMMTTAPLAADASLRAAEVRLARVVASRIAA